MNPRSSLVSLFNSSYTMSYHITTATIISGGAKGGGGSYCVVNAVLQNTSMERQQSLGNGMENSQRG